MQAHATTEEVQLPTVRQKLKQLRELMRANKVDAYYVPSTDPHQSEYVPACWQRRQWLSGFTGSAGDLLITSDTAGLWTDGRYFLQAAQQLKGSTIKLFKQGVQGVPSLSAWLSKNLRPDQVLAVDPRVVSRSVAGDLEQALDLAGARFKLLDKNLVDQIWEDRPPPSKAPLELQLKNFAGEGVASKLRRLRRAMADSRAEAHVLTTLDTIAWLFNVRAADVDYNPVAIAYAVVTTEQAVLFTDPDKVSGRVRGTLGPQVEVRPYDEIAQALARLKRARRRVWVDGATVNQWVLGKLKGCDLLFSPTPVAVMKARKNAAEVAGAKEAHLRDGVAMVRFLRWLDRQVPKGGVTELSAAAKLHKTRARGELYRGESFETIVGFGAHGAIIHYAADEQSDVELRPGEILLVDSGGQYLDGTTDITRTVLLGGEATAEQRELFTRVLKGHIAIARCSFPAGTAGRQIDILARLALWNVGLNYNHGTGHGVGSYLSVHEGPQSISPVRCTGVPLEEGNILSNEPGFYKEGEFGIRIENLVLVVEDEELSGNESPFFTFETLTLCPIDTRLVESSMLADHERRWLNAYHERVREALSEHLSKADAAWLRRATEPI
jgi:Xaa-Pro aminopeptidase